MRLAHFLLLVILGVCSIEGREGGRVTQIANKGKTMLGHLGEVIKTRLNIVYNKLGIIECAGLDTVSGGDLFKHILGPEADFGGDYLCGPTCGGACVPYQSTRVAPISAYPFGCKCPAQRCSPNGPLIGSLARPIFKVVCVPDNRCTCEGMNRNKFGRFEPQMGYLCNWINLNLNQTVAFADTPDNSHSINPTYSPIRWCACCPGVQY